MRKVLSIMDVIVLDGNQRSALAAVRSLGRKGIRVAVGEKALPCLSSRSKYCGHAFAYPSPYINPEGFVEKIQEVCIQNSGAELFPMTDVTLSEVLKNKDHLSNYAHIPFVDHEKHSAASDKEGLFRLADDLKIPIPKTLFSTDFKRVRDLMSAANDLGFPCVIKPAKSRIRTAHGWMNTSVRYAITSDKLREILDNEPFQSYPFLIQERVEGPGIGIFLLMQNGSVLARFAHQRIREKPPGGGVSVLCQSISPPPEALEAATSLMKSLGWFGVTMVEFKWDRRDNKPKLMEVNGRFWGSLQLAISSGIDFPYLLYCLAIGKRIKPPSDYKVGVRSRWELGDLDHLLIRLIKRSQELLLQPNAPSKLSVLTNYILDFFKPCVRHEILRPDDPGPFLFELKQYLRPSVR